MELLLRLSEGMKRWTLLLQLILFALIIFGGILFLISLPLISEAQGPFIGLFGSTLSVGLALSSTPLLGNALAAMMIRFVNPFDTGDIIRVDDCFGRVISQGAFHTEVQAENHMLIITPNLILATKEIDFMRSYAIMVSARVSLGYAVSSDRIERVLISAAEDAELTDLFVFIASLGDFSVSYKVRGPLSDPAKLLARKVSCITV